MYSLKDLYLKFGKKQEACIRWMTPEQGFLAGPL